MFHVKQIPYMIVPTNITRGNNANKINLKQILVKNDYYLVIFLLRINLKTILLLMIIEC